MAGASISSDKWVLDADLEGQKEQQTLKVRPSRVAGPRMVICRVLWLYARTGMSA